MMTKSTTAKNEPCSRTETVVLEMTPEEKEMFRKHVLHFLNTPEDHVTPHKRVIGKAILEMLGLLEKLKNLPQYQEKPKRSRQVQKSPEQIRGY